jgi:hypothetical protein
VRLEIGDVSGDKRDVLQSVDLHGGVGDRLKRKGAVVLEPGDAFACAARSSLQVSQTTIDGRAVEVDQVLDSGGSCASLPTLPSSTLPQGTR